MCVQKSHRSIILTICLSFFVILFSGCGFQQNDDLEKDNKAIEKNSSSRKVDFVLVIDNSGSMADEHTTLAKYATNFLYTLSKLKIDYQIGITSTDTSNRNYPSGCLVGKAPIVSSQMNISMASKILSNNIQKLGFQGSSQEKGVTAALHSWTIRREDKRCANAKLFREGAFTHFVFISDEQDHSSSKDVYHFVQSLRAKRNNVVMVSTLSPQSVYWKITDLTNGYKADIKHHLFYGLYHIANHTNSQL